jgi:hypothetical protein
MPVISRLAAPAPELARRLLSKPSACVQVREKNLPREIGDCFRSPDLDVAPHPVIEFVGTADIQFGDKVMASREQNRSGWYVSGASKFLWTDFGALFGLIAVAGFAVFRAWF